MCLKTDTSLLKYTLPVPMYGGNLSTNVLIVLTE